MKSKESYSKKFIFDLLVPKSLFVSLFLSSSKDVVFNISISDINYAERVAQIANILVSSQVNNRTLQESTILYVSIKFAIIEMVGEHVSMPHI